MAVGVSCFGLERFEKASTVYTDTKLSIKETFFKFFSDYK